MAFVFANDNTNLLSYLNNITGGTHILNTNIQRDFTKSLKWKSDLIFYMMWVGEVPGKIYFHPVPNEKGEIIQESLDGKSRTSAPDEFMKGLFKLDVKFEAPGFEHLYGKYYSEFTPADQNRFKITKVSIAEANRTLSKIEANIFFRFIKTPSGCKTGEGLHSDLESPNRAMLDNKLKTDPKFNEFIHDIWGKDKKFLYYTIIANCLMYRIHGSKKMMNNDELASFWHIGVSEGVFNKVIELMQKVWQFKNTGIKIKNIHSASVFCPFFMIFSECLSEERIDIIHAKWNEKEQFGLKVNGNHNITHSRYQTLLEMSI